MAGINIVVLEGRLTSDPILRKSRSNKSVTSFAVAVNRRTGSGESTADFINCIVWGSIADAVAKYCYKGQLVSVEGRWSTRKYVDKQGNNRYVSECVCHTVNFLERKSDDTESVSSVSDSSFEVSEADYEDYGATDSVNYGDSTL